jgi:hypothetical protein
LKADGNCADLNECSLGTSMPASVLPSVCVQVLPAVNEYSLGTCVSER